MKILKQIKRVASTVMTVASAIVLFLSLGIVDVSELRFAPFAVFFAAIAWLWYVIGKKCKKGGAV